MSLVVSMGPLEKMVEGKCPRQGMEGETEAEQGREAMGGISQTRGWINAREARSVDASGLAGGRCHFTYSLLPSVNSRFVMVSLLARGCPVRVEPRIRSSNFLSPCTF